MTYEVINIMTKGVEGGVPLAGKWSTFHISATHCRQLWPQVTPTLMPTTTLSPLPFYTFGQQASKGNVTLLVSLNTRKPT